MFGRVSARNGHRELVIFDCDGVLVDSEPISIRVDAVVLAELGMHLSEQELIDRFVGRSPSVMRQAIEAHLGHPLPDDWIERSRPRYAEAFERELQPIDGIEEALDRISAATCVASSSEPDELAFKLKLTGLYERFAGRIFSAARGPQRQARARSLPVCGAADGGQSRRLRRGRGQPVRRAGRARGGDGGVRLHRQRHPGADARGPGHHGVRRHARAPAACCKAGSVRSHVRAELSLRLRARCPRRGARRAGRAEMLQDGEIALLAGDGGLEAINGVAHDLGLVSVPLVRGEDSGQRQEQTVMAYAENLPLVWVSAAFGDGATAWARDRGPMTLLVAAGGPLSRGGAPPHRALRGHARAPVRVAPVSP